MLPWYFVPLLTDGAVTGVRTQRQEARTVFTHFGVPGIRKSTWIWITHSLDITAVKEKNPTHYPCAKENTVQRVRCLQGL